MMSICDMVPPLQYANAMNLNTGTSLNVRQRKSGQHQRLQRATSETNFDESVEFFLQAVAAVSVNHESNIVTNAQVWDSMKSLNGEFKMKSMAKETVWFWLLLSGQPSLRNSPHARPMGS